jgi:SpoIID/LytB domain protein
MRRRFSTALVAALVAALLFPMPHALGSSDFTFYGSGYGHGIGMSQWGAYGLANAGWSHQRILTHFYRGTEIGPRSDLPAAIRIGLTTGRTSVRLRAETSGVRLWEGKPGRTLIGEIPPGVTWTVHAKADSYAVRDAGGALVGGRKWGGLTTNLNVTYADAGGRVFIPEADGIWNSGFAYNRGSVEFNLYSCGDANGCAARVIARLPFEEYLYGLGEVPASWPVETLRAQAVAARSYAVATMRKGLRADCNCHMSDGAGDQTYIGYNREGGAMGSRWVQAVKDTRGVVVTYQGAVIQAFYAASDGGHSENVEDVWHGGNPAYAIPWLRGVCNPGEWTAANPWKSWTRSFDAASLSSRLRGYTGSIGTITTFGGVERGISGRIVRLTAVGTQGTRTITGSQLRAGLGLPDGRVWINADRTVTGALRSKYDALMCGPGMPASVAATVPGGAQQFFDNGGLYRNATQDLTVWLKGAIDAEYRAVGAAGGILGVPASAPRSLTIEFAACASCRRADFVRGRIYWKAGVGAHALWGPVYQAYLSRGGTGSQLGFPLTRVRNRSDGGTRARFEGGRIVCGADGSCRVALS